MIKRNKAAYINAAPGRKMKQFKKSIPLYIIMIIPLLVFILIKYVPMYGLQIAFSDYRVQDGIVGSAWVGLENFKRFVTSYNFFPIMKNTLTLSLYQLLIGFPLPIILALAFNSITRQKFKKVVQLVTYAPHFISVVVMCGIVFQILAPRTGIVNQLLSALGLSEINFMGSASLFSSIFVWSGIWQHAGWGTIIYLSALSGIDSQLHEADAIDGASLFKRVINIDLMGILPIIVTMLLMEVGQILCLGFQKVLLLQTPLNIAQSEIIDTYVYKIGLAAQVPDFSYATAIGLFTGIINLVLLLTVNRIAKGLGENSLW